MLEHTIKILKLRSAGLHRFAGTIGWSGSGILALGVVTVVGLEANFNTMTAGSLFLICVIIQALRGDFWSASIVSTAGAFALAYFFTPPAFSLGISNPIEEVVVLTFIISALVISHSIASYRTQEEDTTKEGLASTDGSRSRRAAWSRRMWALVRTVGDALVIGAFLLLVYGGAGTYSNHRYLKGFSDAIVPLEGSPQDKTEALLAWFRHEPARSNPRIEGTMSLRDPVTIVQNQRLLKVCGSASNAFMNLAVAAGLKVRRLLLLDSSGNTMHVVAEVLWGDRWVVVDPQRGLVFEDHLGRGLTKEELRDPKVFQDAISRMPGYSPSYTFGHTVHIRLRSIPMVGRYMRRTLNYCFPGWEESINWAYFPENPSLWLIFVSIPLLLFGILSNLIVNRYGRNRPEINSVGLISKG